MLNHIEHQISKLPGKDGTEGKLETKWLVVVRQCDNVMTVQLNVTAGA